MGRRGLEGWRKKWNGEVRLVVLTGYWEFNCGPGIEKFGRNGGVIWAVNEE